MSFFNQLFTKNTSTQPRSTQPVMAANTIAYAVGDIHGRNDLLEPLLERIILDATNRPEQRRVLIFLGDYVDRGAYSKQVLDTLINFTHPAISEVVFLRGNHEEAMTGFMDDPIATREWLLFGGQATLFSYGITLMANADAPEAVLQNLQQQLLELMPHSHAAFLEGLVNQHIEGDYAFVHAGINPRRPLAQQQQADLLWIRNAFLDWPKPFEKFIIHGHTIENQPVIRANRIGIDTGAFATGVLTCLALHGTEQRFL